LFSLLCRELLVRPSLRKHNYTAPANPHPLPNLPLPRPGLLIGRDWGKGEEHNGFPPLQVEGEGGGGVNQMSNQLRTE